MQGRARTHARASRRAIHFPVRKGAYVATVKPGTVRRPSEDRAVKETQIWLERMLDWKTTRYRVLDATTEVDEAMDGPPAAARSSAIAGLSPAFACAINSFARARAASKLSAG